MLEPVARNKLSFRTSGLFQDGRGVVVGQTAVVLLLSVERVVSLLRLLSEELPLDDLLPSLRIEVVENALNASSYLLRFQSSDSLLLDRVARLARLVGAPLCVGAGHHFVAYRDERAPLGYDVTEPLAEPLDVAIYTPAFSQPYRLVRELKLAQLLGQLQLLPLPGGLRAQLFPLGHEGQETAPETPSEMFLTCGRGLLERLLRYLWQHGVNGELLIPDGLPRPEVPAHESRQIEPMVRLISPPVPLLLRLASLPTVRLLRLEGTNFLVELGFAHPLRLTSLQSQFPIGDSFVFLGGRRGLLRAQSPSRMPLTRLLKPSLGTDPETATHPEPRSTPLAVRALSSATNTPPPLKVSLRLSARPGLADCTPPMATLIPWPRLGVVQRLLGLLSGDALFALRAVGIPAGLLVFGGESVQHLVAGRLFEEPAPQVYVPRGFQLLPELPPSQLRSLLGQSEDHLILFVPEEAQPLSVNRSLALPLSLRLLTALASKVADSIIDPAAVREPATVLHCEPVSFFSTMPLWGLSSERENS